MEPGMVRCCREEQPRNEHERDLSMGPSWCGRRMVSFRHCRRKIKIAISLTARIERSLGGLSAIRKLYRRACGKPQLRGPGQMVAGPEVEPQCRTRCRHNKCQTTRRPIWYPPNRGQVWASQAPRI